MVNWHSQPNTASFLSMDNEKLRSICMFYERISNCSLKMRHKKGFIFMLHLFKLGTKSGWCVASIFTVQLINACLLLFYKIEFGTFYGIQKETIVLLTLAVTVNRTTNYVSVLLVALKISRSRFLLKSFIVVKMSIRKIRR
jgi:hypothetical protein